MALQNIGAGNRDDAFYRYKMPRMITKIEGRGNGIKTNVVNMVEIAKALARPASYTTKYFGCELGAQSKFDEKTGTSHVNGAHETAKLAGLLENFIKKYVQCYGCGNPETEIIITKTQMITLKCAACGFISDVDMRDKLTTFILKNPPEAKKGGKDKKAMRRAERERLKEGEAADEELKKIKKEAAKKKSSSTTKESSSKNGVATSKKKAQGSDEDRSPSGSQADDNEPAATADEDDDVEWQTDTSFEAAQKRIQEQLSAVTSEMVMLTTKEEEKPSRKKSPERDEKPSRKKSPEHDETKQTKSNGNHTELTPQEKLVKDIKDFLGKGSTASQLKAHLESLSGTSEQEVANAVFEALFAGVGKGFSKEVTKKMRYLACIGQEEGSQFVLLGAIEDFCCGKGGPDAVKEVALVVKALYDADLLEEEFIMKWYHKGCSGENKSSAVWKNMKPFVEWLQSAESETEEE